jgi:hypothetical protein
MSHHNKECLHIHFHHKHFDNLRNLKEHQV